MIVITILRGHPSGDVVGSIGFHNDFSVMVKVSKNVGIPKCTFEGVEGGLALIVLVERDILTSRGQQSKNSS